ncbi:MAG: TolC family protein [Flavitalea sp.]
MNRLKESMKLFFIPAALFLTISAVAQQPRKLTLNEAINLAVASSGQLKYSGAKVKEAVAAVRETKEKQLPNVSVSGSHIRLNNPNIDLKVKQNNTNPPSEPVGKVSSATYGLLNVSLPLYNGSKIKYGIESATYLAEAAKLDAEDNRDEIILNAINAFDNLYKSKEAVVLVKENLGSATERVKQFTSLEKNGIIPRNDLLKAELQSSNIELSLMDAENNWKLANINMDLLLGIADSTELDPDISSLPPQDKLKGVDEMIQSAMQYRKDLASLQLKKKAAGIGIKLAKSELYPSLSLTGGYIAATIPNLLTVTNAVNIGLGVQYNLASLWKNNSKVEQAEAREIQLQANEGLLSDAIRLQVHQAYLDYTLSIKKIDTYKNAVDQAEENYKIVKNKYDNSLATTTDLLDADVAQLQTRLNYAFSRADASASYSRLLKSAGMLSAQVKK